MKNNVFGVISFVVTILFSNKQMNSAMDITIKGWCVAPTEMGILYMYFLEYFCLPNFRDLIKESTQ